MILRRLSLAFFILTFIGCAAAWSQDVADQPSKPGRSPVLDYSRRLLYCGAHECSVKTVFSYEELQRTMLRHISTQTVTVRSLSPDVPPQTIQVQIPVVPIILGGCFGAELPSGSQRIVLTGAAPTMQWKQQPAPVLSALDIRNVR